MLRILGVTLALLPALASVPLSAQPATACTSGVLAKPGFCFASDVIDALSAAHVAALARPDTAGMSESLVGLGASLLYASGRQRAGIDDALLVLRPYLTHRDTVVRSAARELSESLRALRAHSLASDSAVRIALDGSSERPSVQAQRMADLKSRRHAAASMLVLSTIASTYALLEKDPRDAERMRLQFTDGEREALRTRLYERFGSSLEPAAAGGQYDTDYAAAAAMLNKFLGQEWATRP